ncbi:unnamed protein product [Larinioides sclopetarius]|uniref:Uncharacterized protein n=1 Tax=Larinioides sclopetarius TaxID=280406 RepID=A0AAV1ZG41_9ARAC
MNKWEALDSIDPYKRMEKSRPKGLVFCHQSLSPFTSIQLGPAPSTLRCSKLDSLNSCLCYADLLSSCLLK